MSDPEKTDPEAPEDPGPGEEATTPPGGVSSVGAVVYGLLGILLPLACVGVEVGTGMCADVLFAPLATPLHPLLVLVVPLAVYEALQAVRRRNTSNLARLELLTAFALGVSTMYALAFLPLTPICVMGIIAYGIGLLGLGPLLSGLVLLRLRVLLGRLGDEAGGRPPRRRWAIAAAWVVLFGLEASRVVTLTGAGLALSPAPAVSTAGVTLLRRTGSPRVLWNLGAGDGPAGFGPAGFVVGAGFAFARTLDPGRDAPDFRRLYFRTTGDAWETQPEDDATFPRFSGMFSGNGPRIRRAWRNWDQYVGTRTVGHVLQDLEWKESEIRGSVDPDAALAYLEWTFVFENTSEWRQREARARIQLPPGGVVSRLTLWIEGEEREAAYAGKGQVIAAYERVVARRRDPALVTHAGRDRVFLQCFPIPARQTMKVKLGVTVPLVLTGPGAGELALPYVQARNFLLGDGLTIPVTLASRGELKADLPSLQPRPLSGWLTDPKAAEVLPLVRSFLEDVALGDGAFAARGFLTPLELADARIATRATSGGDFGRAWTLDPRGTDQAGVLQSPGEVPVPKVDRLVLVVDGSAALAPYVGALAKAAAALPVDLERHLLVAHDEGYTQADPGGSLETQLAALRPIGGQDNEPALRRAIEIARKGGRTAVVWIHGPQPYLFDEEAAPVELPDDPAFRFYDLAVGPGDARAVEEIEDDRRFVAVAARGAPGKALAELLGQRLGKGTRRVMIRKRVASGVLAIEPGLHRTSTHLARLWAREEVERLLAVGNHDAAVEVAARYRLVTPVSGAVVLESQEQYDEAGLTPAGETTVPSIPEPETWALLFMTLTLLAVDGRRRAEARA